MRFSIFSYIYLASVYLLRWGTCSGLLPIFKLGCSFFLLLRVLCIFWVTVLYQLWLLQIFSLSLWLVFSFSWRCHYWQKLLILTTSSLSIIYFMDCAFGVLSKKSSPYPKSSRFSPLVPSKGFIALYFTFRSIIHFELIFVKDLRSVSRSFF